MTQYGLTLDPQRIVSDLSVGERQRIEIVRALLLEPDAPDHGRADIGADAAGGGAAVRVLRQLAGEGCSILYISHKLHEIKALCDTATILRGGKVVGDVRPGRGNLALDGREDDRRQPQGHPASRRAGRSAPRSSWSTG